MAAPVVDHIRAVLRDLDRPLTARERCLILASLRSTAVGADAVELLDVARRAVRYRLHSTGTRPAPEVAALLAAVDAVLDPDTQPDEAPPVRVDERLAMAHADRRRRADVD